MVGKLAQPPIQPGLIRLGGVLHQGQVLLQLLDLFAPLGQLGQVPLQGGHVGLSVLLVLLLQVVQAALGAIQFAGKLADAVVERITRLLVLVLAGLKGFLPGVELGLGVGQHALGTMTVGVQLGPELPQCRLQVGNASIHVLQASQ